MNDEDPRVSMCHDLRAQSEFVFANCSGAQLYTVPRSDMATPVILGVSAIAAAVLGRSIVKKGLFVGKGAAEQWVKGGFRAKMDRKEAIAILGLK